jgi:hypothetical protein
MFSYLFSINKDLNVNFEVLVLYDTKHCLNKISEFIQYYNTEFQDFL